MSDDKIIIKSESIDEIAEELEKVENALPNRINADPDNVEHGLAKLCFNSYRAY